MSSLPSTASLQHQGQRFRRLRILLLASSALASAASMTAARATDATWLANPASGDFNNGANWSGGTSPNGTANFGASSIKDIGFSRATFVGGFSVNAGNMLRNDKLAITFEGAGLSVASGATLQFLNSFLLSFTGASPL